MHSARTVVAIVAVMFVAISSVQAEPLWPPSAQGQQLGGFDSSWKIFGGALAAHASSGGRTVAKRGYRRILHVSLPGTFTVPQQFSALLKYSVSKGFDTIGLDYGWGPSPDSKRSAQCNTYQSCQSCQNNYHELIGFGAGTDLIEGAYPVFGDNQTETLKFTHFFNTGVSFLPAFELGADVDLTSPLPMATRLYLESIKESFNVETLLVKVLQELGWGDYLDSTVKPDWSKVVVSGHSQGASHAGYIAYRRDVLGALLLSGPQDACGEDGATWAAEASLLGKQNIIGCSAVDEPGQLAIRRNLDFMTDVIQFNMTGRAMSHGESAWCAPPSHCATGVDDQLADSVVDRCFSKLSAFEQKSALWPPSAQGDPVQMGGFDKSWRILGGIFAAHAAEGGRTVAKRGLGKMLHLSLPGTFTVPQQFSTLLKFSVAAGFDTIGLDYGWGPSPDSKRSAQCAKSGHCQECQNNYHELICFGGGADLIAGQYPVFGENQTETLKFTHFFNSGVSFLPAFALGADVDVASPLPSAARDYIEGIKETFSVEILLAKVLRELGWSEYLSSGAPDWSKIVISGHSQGASHAGYIAYRRNVQGALLLSGPQDACGNDGAAWVVEASRLSKANIFGCYANDEPGKPAIERNLGFMTEVAQVDMTSRSVSHGASAWCAPPTHCATGVDDQLADATVEQCFSTLLAFGREPEASVLVQESESSDADALRSGSLLLLIFSCLSFACVF